VSKNSSIRFLVVLPAIAFLAFAITAADLGALAAQNANSSTTGEGAAQEGNANANRGTRRGRAQRGRRPAPTNIDGSPAVDPSEGQVDPSESPAATRGLAQETDTGVGAPGEATDLSGTYTGRVQMTGGHEMSGTGTLTITGNTFTLAMDGMTHNGRIIAITTRGYTGATLWFTDIADPSSNTPVAAAVRVRKGRNNVTMTPVPGARTRLTFNGRAG
jgi:hypothetical protein